MLVEEFDDSSILSRRQRRRQGIGRWQTSLPMFYRIVSWWTCKRDALWPRKQFGRYGWHLRVEMRMADDNQFQSTRLLNFPYRVFVEIRNKVPQDVAMWRLDEAGRLTDSNLFFNQSHFTTLIQQRGDASWVDILWVPSIPRIPSRPSRSARRRSCGLHREASSTS